MTSIPRWFAAFSAAALVLPALATAQTHTPPAGGPPPRAATAAELADTARVRKWREDVRFITTQVRTLHPRPFTHVSEAAFDSATRAIEARVPTTDDAHLAVDCMRLVAMLRDGHSACVGTFPPLGFLSVLPVALRPFADGVYVIAADSAHAALAGARVTKIGELSADDAIARVGTVVNSDNRSTELDRVPLFLMMPKLLEVVGVSRDANAVTLELEQGGRTQRVTLRGASAPDGFPQQFLETEPEFPASWATARRVAPEKLPRMDQRPADAWWFRYEPESKLVYLRLRRIEPVSSGLAYPEFYRELFFAVDSLKPRALIVDLRHDHGGNNTILDPLIRGIVERPWLDREGGLFTLIDRGTFSAAMNAAVFLDQSTSTRFVGEPTGGRVNHYGDARGFETPNFHLLLNVSTVPWLARFPQDPREWIAPEIAVPWTFADWRDGRDPAYEAAVDAAWNGTLAQRVFEAARRGGTAAGKTAYDAWLKEHPNPWVTEPNGQLVSLASDLGDQRDWKGARLLAETYTVIDPKSATAWRLLAEAEYQLGNRDGAVAAARKATTLTNFAPFARLLLERMGEKP